jgi:hypothetical protein
VAQVPTAGCAETAKATDEGLSVVVFAGGAASKRADDVGPNVLGYLRQRKRLFIFGHV